MILPPQPERPELARLLQKAAAHKMSKREIEAQCQSWIAGEIGMGSDADEAAYAVALVRGDTAEIARLDAEAEARVKRILNT